METKYFCKWGWTGITGGTDLPDQADYNARNASAQGARIALEQLERRG
jgi:hypothetical protein